MASMTEDRKILALELMEVKSQYVAYWKATVGTLGFLKEVGVAAVTGQVVNTGVQRQLLESDLEQARRESKELEVLDTSLCSNLV